MEPPIDSNLDKAVIAGCFLALIVIMLMLLFIFNSPVELLETKENPIVKAAYKNNFIKNQELEDKINKLELRINLLEKRLKSSE